VQNNDQSNKSCGPSVRPAAPGLIFILELRGICSQSQKKPNPRPLFLPNVGRCRAQRGGGGSSARRPRADSPSGLLRFAPPNAPPPRWGRKTKARHSQLLWPTRSVVIHEKVLLLTPSLRWGGKPSHNMFLRLGGRSAKCGARFSCRGLESLAHVGFWIVHCRPARSRCSRGPSAIVWSRA